MQEPAQTPGLNAEAEQPCPMCQARIPVYQGFITWCDQCGWNLRPYIPEKPRTLIDSTYEALGQRFGRGLVEHHECGGNLAGGVLVTDALGGGDAGLVEGFGEGDVFLLLGTAAGHEVAGDSQEQGGQPAVHRDPPEQPSHRTPRRMRDRPPVAGRTVPGVP